MGQKQAVLLLEMQREAERLIDHQIQAIEELDDKSEQMLRLALGTLAGSLAIGAFVLRGYAVLVNGVAAAGFALGLLANLCAGMFFVSAYVGLRTHRHVEVAPDAQWICDHSQKPGWTMERHLAHVLAAYPGFQLANQVAMQSAANERRRGLYVLAVSVTTHALTYAYVLAGAIIL